MSKHTTFKIGGNADFFVLPKTPAELIDIWQTCKKNETPITVLGDGANVLVSDNGIRGVVVSTNKMNAITLDGERVTAMAGARLSALAQFACNESLAGLPFASGIPGTVGGAIYMNAGAYGSEMKDFVESVTLFSEGKTITKTCAEMDFGYRKSFVQSGDMLILEAVFKLQSGNREKIREEMQSLAARRKESNPPEPSAGSFFKRPEGNFAGKLIQDSGLKGFAVGDAQVSEKHAGFVVNKGNATAADVIALMRHVQKTVREKFDVQLEPEVRILE
jgi:UDP-N-acetylmuramate dehydrogenase